MRPYTTPHAYYCGVDLHARSLSSTSSTTGAPDRLEQDLPAGPERFLEAMGALRDGLVVSCRVHVRLVWLADLCERERNPVRTRPRPST